ncbi:MAG: hypothetical protein V3V97_10370 [Hyphomicrobiaceae bacterium]
MVDQLLWIDALVKFSFGVLLTVIPRLPIAAFGLAKTNQMLYPRIIGALLIGISFALIFEGAGKNSTGLGLKGAATINLAVAILISALLLFTEPAPARRGRIALWSFVVALVTLSLVQSLYA